MEVRRRLLRLALNRWTWSAALVLLVSACVTAEAPPDTTPDSSAEPGTTVTPTTVSPTERRRPEVTTSTAEGTIPTAAPTVASSTTVAQAPTTAPLPGEPSDFGPDRDADLVVVGVEHADVLNVRDTPAGDIIATLDLLSPYVGILEVRSVPSREVLATPDSWEDAIVATGRARTLPTTTWYELRAGGLTGWASAAYLAQTGTTDDLTSHIVETLGEQPRADTMVDLGLTVAGVVAPGEPASRVVVSVAPIVFEAIGEITIDVLNVGDDSIFGFKLAIFAHVEGDWMSEDPGPFTLRSVESTVLCYADRGVTEDGFCI